MFESWVVIAALAAAGAADASQCTEIADGGQRLACYDALFRVTGQPAAGNTLSMESVAPRPETAQSVAPAAAPTAAAPAVATTQEQDFGLSEQQRAERDGTTNRLDEIRAVVVEIHESRVGKPAYTLDNGQRWRQVEATSRPQLKVGATVVISKAALGSFMAKMPDIGGPPARVRREE